MKKQIAFIIILLATFCTYGQNSTVSIPDTNFLKALIVNGVDKNNDKQIQESEAQIVTNLKVNSFSIIDITGIQAFVNLDTLICSNNSWQFVGLDVSKNTKLTHLECIGLNLYNLDLSKNTALIHLECKTNNLTKLDVSKNTSLEYLHCSYNNLSALDVTLNLNLKYLACYDNKIKILNVGNNIALSTLQCSNNQISSLDVSKNVNLNYFLCESNNMTILQMGDNFSLTSMDCGGNRITSLDVSKALLLTSLDCSENRITKLDISKNTALTGFYFGINTVKSIICINTNQLSDTTHWNLFKGSNSSWSTTCSDPTGLEELPNHYFSNSVVKIYTLLGQIIDPKSVTHGLYIFQYDDGSIKRLMITE